MELADYLELDIVYPLRPATITFEVSAVELELAMEFQGENLRPRLMAAIYAALSVDCQD